MKRYSVAFGFCLCFAAFGFAQAKNTLVFQPVFNGKSFTLGEKIALSDGHWIAVSGLKFYISSLVFEGESASFKDTTYCHLVDADLPETLTLAIPSTRFHSLRFCVGTDSSINVAGILDGDLDPIKGMYWAWNSGYINFKLEGTSSLSAAPNKAFEFHIGGYLSPYPTIQSITLPIHSKDITIQVEIGKFFEQFPLSKTASVMVPGKLAVEVSAIFPSLFNSIANEN